MSNKSGLVGPGGAPIATKQILGDDELRAKQAAQEIKVILEAYDCQLFPVMMLSPKGVIGVSVDVLPNSRLSQAQEAAVAQAKGPVTEGNVKDIKDDAPTEAPAEDTEPDEAA